MPQRLGYIVECDLEYPDHLHDEQHDYPMALEYHYMCPKTCCQKQFLFVVSEIFDLILQPNQQNIRLATRAKHLTNL